MKSVRPIACWLLAALVVACGDSDQRPASVQEGSPPATLSAAAAATQEADVWEALRRRPLNLPTLAPGEDCPRTPGRHVTRFYAAALGGGPVYPVGLGEDGVLHYGEGGPTEEWAYAKVLWVKSRKYRGPALIRGHQIDGPNELRFEDGSDPPAELKFPSEGTAFSPGVSYGWTERPSYTRVRAPGCYAYQVDGFDFSEVIVFQAVP